MSSPLLSLARAPVPPAAHCRSARGRRLRSSPGSAPRRHCVCPGMVIAIIPTAALGRRPSARRAVSQLVTPPRREICPSSAGPAPPAAATRAQHGRCLCRPKDSTSPSGAEGGRHSVGDHHPPEPEVCRTAVLQCVACRPSGWGNERASTMFAARRSRPAGGATADRTRSYPRDSGRGHRGEAAQHISGDCHSEDGGFQVAVVRCLTGPQA